MDSQIDLQQPVLDSGIRSINFFNGRLLSARDLTREQSAYREGDKRLGKAIGEGVAYGLEVSPASTSRKDSPAVSVEAGLAINRNGQTLALSARTDVALVRSSGANAAAQVFSDCLPLQTGTYVSGAGLYLLTIAPAQTVEGRAITNGLNPVTSSCSTDTLVSTVQFRLIQIDSAFTANDLQNEALLRNLVAYKCFGVADTNAFIADPFNSEIAQWGLLDGLRPNQLTDCEVPLAVLYWTDKDGLNFVDMWSVRRRIVAPQSSSAWASLNSDRRVAEAEAMFMQFQEQIESVCLSTTAEQTRAVDQFRYVPAVGFIPLAQDGFTFGFHPDLFFDTLTLHTDVFIEGARVEQLLRASFNYPPVDLKAENKPVMLWIYKVRENRQKKTAGEASRQPYFIFSSGHMPYMADPHFDVNRWEYSNYP
jgi:hypothetical protein